MTARSSPPVPRGRGRPLTTEDALASAVRDRQLAVRVSRADLWLWTEAARRAGLSLSEWIRERLEYAAVTELEG